ncbi:MAG TPA: aspartate aminotransferase family protein [Symbiobacteriaceae bacterium]|nr:aspartate aminotransferase family protein [Symbiobacteriaceae bacterium]
MTEGPLPLPARGMPTGDVLARLRALRTSDANWKDGKTWSLVYYAGEELTELLKAAYGEYIHENGLGPMAFHSLQKMEADVIAMAAHLLGGDGDVVGNMTSGGSESILMAVKTARDLARAERPAIAAPEIVLPASAHPAFLKAAHYFGLKPLRVPVAADLRADVAAMAAAITENCVLLVGSAPSYPHGVIDPIRELAAIAAERKIPMHVDSCVGGFLLPFVRKLGHPIPDFDFAVPGVTSMSADLHKYGFGAKGSSIVLYRNRQIRRHQYFAFADWSGGIYGSPTMAGTRPGGAISAAWAVMNHLGEEGYLKLASTIMETTKALMQGISAIPGLCILGRPEMSVFAFASDTLNVYALADAMEARGWFLDRQQQPVCLHMMVTPAHAGVVQSFLSDLRECAAQVAAVDPDEVTGAAALYGALATIPDRGAVQDVVLDFMDEWTKVKE